MNQLTAEIFESSNFNPERQSLDLSINTRGRSLINIMETNDFILLNGRSMSDTPASYTFTGAQGCSVGDLIWCSREAIPLFKDLLVLPIATFSDHLPVLLYKCYPLQDKSLDFPPSPNRLHFDSNKAIPFLSSIAWRGEVSRLELDVDSLNNVFTSTIKTVAKDLGMTRMRSHFSSFKESPWIDRECKQLKKRVSNALRVARVNNFCQESKHIYQNEKRNMVKIVASKKVSYRKKLTYDLSNCNNSTQFWKVVNSTRLRSSKLSNIELSTWYKFLQDSYPARSVKIMFDSNLYVTDALLDGPFSFHEIVQCLLRCKVGGAPGMDGIAYGFYKNLPQNWLIFLEHFLNKILSTEIVPRDWGKFCTFMLFKKGLINRKPGKL